MMDIRTDLRVLMNRYGTDKTYVHHYEEEYERHFAPFRGEEFNLLEIGIGGYGAPMRGGASLKVWRDYFPQAWIYGLDTHDKSFLNGDRLSTFRGDQSDSTLLRLIHEEVGPFRVIIDDGSHVQCDIMDSFRVLFPLLQSGGIYVIEDMATAYDPAHGGIPDPITYVEDIEDHSIVLLFHLIDGMHWAFWKGRGPDDIQKMVKSVHVSKELAFIYKH